MGRQDVGRSRLAAGSSGRSTRQSRFVRHHVVEGGGTTRLLAIIAAPVRPLHVSVGSPNFEPPRPWTGTCVFI
uniref:Uncharacterized protein n=1 Tax=Triticum urartu TaxID=4572 RepID=A0A8R7UIG5_TRIUA